MSDAAFIMLTLNLQLGTMYGYPTASSSCILSTASRADTARTAWWIEPSSSPTYSSTRSLEWKEYMKQNKVMARFPKTLYYEGDQPCYLRGYGSDLWIQTVWRDCKLWLNDAERSVILLDAKIRTFAVRGLKRGWFLELSSLENDGRESDSIERWHIGGSLIKDTIFDRIRERSDPCHGVLVPFRRRNVEIHQRCRLLDLPIALLLDVVERLSSSDQLALHNVCRRLRYTVPYPVVVRILEYKDLSLTKNGPPLWWIDDIKSAKPKPPTPWQMLKARATRQVRNGPQHRSRSLPFRRKQGSPLRYCNDTMCSGGDKVAQEAEG